MTALAGDPSSAEPTQRLAQRTVSGLVWAGAASGGRALLSLGIVMVLARLLAPADFGMLAMAIAFVGLAGAVVQRSVGPALEQRHALSEEHVATGTTLALGLAFALAATLFVLAPPISALVDEPGLAPVLRSLSPLPVFAALAVVSEHLLRRHLEFGWLTAASLAAQTLGGGVVAIGLALLDCGVWALVGGVLARQALFAAFLQWRRSSALRLRISRRETADLLRMGTGFTLISLLNTIAWHGTRLGLGGALGTAALGLYVFADRLASVPAAPSSVLGEVLFPAMSRRQHRPDRLASVLGNSVELMLLAGLPAGAAIAVAAPEIVAVVLGEQWRAAVPAMSILASAAALMAGLPPHVAAIRARGAVYREAWRRALHPPLLLGGIWAGSYWGLAGAAAAVAGAGLVLHFMLVRLSLAELGMTWRELARRYLPGLWVCAWSTPALWLVLELSRGASFDAPAALGIAGLAGAAAAAASLRLAPRFASPGCLAWALDRVAFDTLGAPGRLARAVIAWLAGPRALRAAP